MRYHQAVPLNDDARQAFWQRSQAAWPALACDQASFWRLTERCCELLRTDAATADLANVNGRDIYIVAALLDEKPGAYQAFDQTFLQPTRGALARTGLNDAGIADAMQIVRERLLLPHDGQPPRIVDVVGQGDLTAFLRVVAVRTALNLRRTDARLDNEDQTVFDKLIASHNPEQDLLKKEARELLKSAIAAAVQSLSPRDKTLLRLHFFHQLTIDDLGRMYDVHRATAARWLGKIHEQLDRATRDELARRLDTTSDHLESVLLLAHSNLRSSFHQVWNELAGGQASGATAPPIEK
jgi:RNA polymerase sigma-70 factor (ECF subfamily)